MEGPLYLEPEDRRQGPVAIVLWAPGQQPYPLRVPIVGARLSVQRGAWVHHYDLWGVDPAGRLVYRLTTVEPRPACEMPHDGT